MLFRVKMSVLESVSCMHHQGLTVQVHTLLHTITVSETSEVYSILRQHEFCE
jgi:hypothetical protein